MIQALKFESGVESGSNHIKITFGTIGLKNELIPSYEIYYPRNTTVFTSVIGVDEKGGTSVTAFNIINTSIGGSIIITVNDLKDPNIPIQDAEGLLFDTESFTNFLLSNTSV